MAYQLHGRPIAAGQKGINRPSLPGLASSAPSSGTRVHHVIGQRQIAPGDAAQARLFEDMLRAEIIELLALPPVARVEKRARIAELDRLIKNLRHRFAREALGATPAAQLVPRAGERTPRAVLN